MVSQENGAREDRPLGILGISEAEESIYRYLLDKSSGSTSEVARYLGQPRDKAQRLLDALEAKGLTSYLPERPRRYMPTSPDIALKALSLRHRQGLQRADSVIRDLQNRITERRREEPEPMVELIKGRESERHIFDYIRGSAREEVLNLMRAPILISNLDAPGDEDNAPQRESQARGVSYRSVADAHFLELPGVIGRLREDIEHGEQIRVFPALPFKLVIVDRRIGLIPLVLDQSSKHIVLLVRSSPLLDALCAMFENFWERAAIVSFAHSGVLETVESDSQSPEEVETILSLLAAGLNDKSIVFELGISLRTYRRRTAELMKILGARTRFQAGWIAARKEFERQVQESLNN